MAASGEETYVKFLCDQCKAKYQISDDKVAGKTVRMKCRKCGHMIEVRAAVTETSVADRNTGTAAAAATTAGSHADSPPSPGGAAPKPPVPGKPAALPPRAPLATSLSQAGKPAPPRPPTQRPEALAGAFKSSMQTAREDEAALLELSSADEWYAAINGVPVGPIRITELRRKAALGAVTDDSLVWQEGMEEWRPVKTIAELASLVREAASSRGPSLGSPEPPNVRQSVLPPSPGHPSMRPSPARPLPPRPASDRPAPVAASGRSNVVPITSRLATAERLDEAHTHEAAPGEPHSERLSIAPDPFSAGGGAASVAATRESFVGAPPQSVQQAPVIVQKQPTNFLGIGMVGAFLAFGGVAAWAIFIKPPPVAPPPQVIVQQVPMQQQPQQPQNGAEPVGQGQDTAPAGSPSSGKTASRAPVAAAAKDAGAAPDLRGLLGGLGPGPNGAPAGPAAQATSLTADQLQSVVTAHGLGVKRTCWERGASTANSANERLTLTISGTNGRVINASSDGNDAITGTCLEKETRNWQFPITGANSTVTIPFHFVRQ